MTSIDPDLAAEAQDFSSQLHSRALRVLGPLGLDVAVGADYQLLYFLIRYHQPERVVETGVAAGFSSQAILAALEANGGDGRLWSSDLPYVRKRASSSLVGVLVDERLRRRWHLRLDGDRSALPQFASSAAPSTSFTMTATSQPVVATLRYAGCSNR